MSSYRITLLAGDGIAPEITSVARRLLEAVAEQHRFSLNFDPHPVGGAAIDASGEPLPASTLEACRSSDAALLAAIGGPKYDTLPREKRPESGLLALRAGMELFANLRPVKIVPALIGASSCAACLLDRSLACLLVGGCRRKTSPFSKRTREINWHTQQIYTLQTRPRRHP